MVEAERRGGGGGEDQDRRVAVAAADQLPEWESGGLLDCDAGDDRVNL